MRFKETEILKKWVYKKEGISLKAKSNEQAKFNRSEADSSEKQDDE